MSRRLYRLTRRLHRRGMDWAYAPGLARLPGEARPYYHVNPHANCLDRLCVRRFATRAALLAWLDRPVPAPPADEPAPPLPRGVVPIEALRGLRRLREAEEAIAGIDPASIPF